MGAITLDHCTKVYPNGVKAVDDLSLHIDDGEFMVLVGPSGCGKSTMLRMIAGLEEVTGGTITIGDRDVTDLAPPERDIAMVFQNYALSPHMSVRENLGFGLKMRKVARSGGRSWWMPWPRLSASDSCWTAAGGAVGRAASAGGDGSGHGP